jgi:ppGpp synthetase/RelA/SpoT-type nucleotidyltranferase
MAQEEGPDQEWLADQIQKYSGQYHHYEAYAKALERVLKQACLPAVPEAIVQARAKLTPSFAEKCVRKFGKYKDPVNQLTDLCGGRVIVQTLEQSKAVRMFVEHNFTVREFEDKGLLLSEDRFGYRDLHFLICLKPQMAADIGFSADECEQFANRVAELQVRSIVQHAWADILHDRMYKAPLKLSAETKRTGALLAAIMEDGDRSFDQLALEVDGMAANYSAYATPENVNREIAKQSLLLGNAEEQDQPAIAIRLARLIASKGKWDEIITLLEPRERITGPLRLGVWLELGNALCRRHRSAPKSAPYQRGQQLLKEVITACRNPELTTVPNLRRDRSIQARALARLGWSFEAIDADAYLARRNYRRAVELEPGNPYYLADMLGFELKFAAGLDLVAGFRASIQAALATCMQHAAAGTELPGAFFTAARLNMLLGEYYSAMNDYACGIRHCLEVSKTCECIDDEIAWLHLVHAGRPLPDEYGWAEQILQLAQLKSTGAPPAPAAKTIKPPVLIVVGGAASLPVGKRPRITSILTDVLAPFTGTIISGGTTSGVPGALGEATANLISRNSKAFRLIGYIPSALPFGVHEDANYDEQIVCGTKEFTPAQVLRSWLDLLNASVEPADVMVIGFGGGNISAIEYRVALALGATVGVVSGSGGSADAILKDPLWCIPPNKLFPLADDEQTLIAVVIRNGAVFDKSALITMAKEFHRRYVADNLKKIRPETLNPWDILPDTYQTANTEQAAYAIRILQAAGFGVREVPNPVVFKDFTPDEIELMAKLEHGRWNIERLRDGWRPGQRDDEKKLHNCIAPWDDLTDGPDGVKRFDRNAVKAFPEILAIVGWEVYRPTKGKPTSQPA